jgi:hypothetical protein
MDQLRHADVHAELEIDSTSTFTLLNDQHLTKWNKIWVNLPRDSFFNQDETDFVQLHES